MAIHPDDEDVREVNRKLLAQFGKTPWGRPLFRVVFANDELEKRLGTFENLAGTIFLGYITEVRLVPKYQWKDRYILERAVENPDTAGEVKDHNWYEGFYVFHDDKFEPLALNYRICEFFCLCVMNSSTTKPWEEKTADEMKQAAETAFNRMVIDDAGSAFYGALMTGEGVSMAGLNAPAAIKGEKQ